MHVEAIDNSSVSIGEEGRIVAQKVAGGSLQIFDKDIWQRILTATTKG